MEEVRQGKARSNELFFKASLLHPFVHKTNVVFNVTNATSLVAGSAANRKMKRVTMRRKLVDLARAQTDEIEFLRMELDRLRQKTFPR